MTTDSAIKQALYLKASIILADFNLKPECHTNLGRLDIANIEKALNVIKSNKETIDFFRSVYGMNEIKHGFDINLLLKFDSIQIGNLLRVAESCPRSFQNLAISPVSIISPILFNLSEKQLDDISRIDISTTALNLPLICHKSFAEDIFNTPSIWGLDC